MVLGTHNLGTKFVIIATVLYQWNIGFIRKHNMKGFIITVILCLSLKSCMTSKMHSLYIYTNERVTSAKTTNASPYYA